MSKRTTVLIHLWGAKGVNREMIDLRAAERYRFKKKLGEAIKSLLVTT